MLEGGESLCSQDKLKLETWGLPFHVLEKYKHHGIISLFPWQVECLLGENVLDGQNLVYSAPTSAGKTLVAEMLMLKTVLEKKRKVMMILPFISVVREKMLYLQEILSGSGIRVEGFMGSYCPPGGFRSVHMAICTIEKANSLINRLLEERSFDNLGCVVVDELHLLGDPHRGYLLELLLTKIKYITKRGFTDIQIIGMSATLPNLSDLAKWLDAFLYKTDFRPVALKEYLKIGRSIYESKELRLSHEITSPTFNIKNDPDDVIYLCIETILQGYSILLFCSTKNWCESIAQQIAAEIRRIGKSCLKLRQQLDSEAISDTLEQLKKCSVGLEPTLERSVSFGVGYHHAGLTMDERDIIEGAYRKNILRVIVATSTLSSGVNLPARRVVIRSPSFAGHRLDILTYKQMIGRAGRMGKDTEGESYLICTEGNKNLGQQLIKSDLPKVESCLGHGNLPSSLKRALIEIIASGLVTSKQEVEEYTNCTLLATVSCKTVLDEAVNASLFYLETNNFISKDSSTSDVIASSLAMACLSASMSPDQAVILLKELDKARKCFVLESDLHAIYQVTPFSVCDQISVDWMKMLSIWEGLSPGLQKIGQLVGVEESFLIKAMRSAINVNSDQYISKLSIHKRFYTALALQDLINEVPLKEVAKKFDCNKGMLQSLQQSASTFSGMVTNFCRKLGWGALEVVLTELGARIQFGVQRDLLDLMRLDCMIGQIARALHNIGIETVRDLAHSDLRTIRTAIKRATPFISENSETADQGLRKNVCLPGRPGLAEIEAADLFIHEARIFLLKEMGVQNIDWSKQSSESLCNSLYDHSTLPPNLTVERLGNGQTMTNSNSEKNKSSVCYKQGYNVNISKEKNLINTSITRNNIPWKKESSEFKVEHSLKKKKPGEHLLKKVNSLLNYDDMMTDYKEILVPATQEFDSPHLESSTKEDWPKFIDVDYVLPKYINTNLTDKEKCRERIASDCKSPVNMVNFSLRFNESYLVPHIQMEDNNSNKYTNVEVNFNDFGNILERNVKSSTPIGSPEQKNEERTSLNPVLEHSSSINHEENKKSSSCCNQSYDLFDSPVDICSKNYVQKTASNQHILELDPNWGGDSLLQVSLVEHEIKQLSAAISCNSKKRKINNPINEDDDNFDEKGNSSLKRNKKPKSSISDLFDSFEMNTQIEMEMINKEERSMFTRSGFTMNGKANGQQAKKSEADSSLVDAFEKTFDHSIYGIKGVTRPNEVDIYPIKTTIGADNLKISGFESQVFKRDYSLTDNNLAEKQRTCKTLCTTPPKLSNSTPLKLYSPSKLNVKSPKRSNKPKDISPSKYPLVGISVIKQNKSFHKINRKDEESDQNMEKLVMIENPSQTAFNKIGISGNNSKEYEPSLCKILHADNENAVIINVCNLGKLVEDFLSNLMHKKKVVFSLQTVDITEDKTEAIGGRLKKCKDPEVSEFKHKSKAIIGMVFTWGQEIYMFDMKSANCICFDSLKSIMQMKDLKLWSYKAKDQIKLLSQCCKILVRCEIYDVRVAKWLLMPEEKSYSLTELVKDIITRFHWKNIKGNEVVQDVMMIWHLHNELMNELERYSLHHVYIDVEMPAQLILMNMELAGIGFDHNFVLQLWTKAEETMKFLEDEAFRLANRKFNLSSIKDFKKIKEALKLKKCFESDQHSLLNIVRNWRKINSLKCRTLNQLLMADSSDGRIYAECSTWTHTGRVMIHDPDLQHVPRDFSVNDVLFSPRSAFTASKGHILLSADFCQLELRILAHFSKDPLLISMINSKKDVFVSIASGWFNYDYDQISEEMRHQTKQLCYGILYGMGELALSEALGVSTTEAAELAAKFRLSYPGVGKFIERCIQDCTKNGYITTLTGRIRRLPHINSNKKGERLKAERQAVNSTIQGSAADIAKKAMVNIERRLEQVYPMRTPLLADGCASHLILQMHDELIFEVAKENVNIVSNIVRNEMENSIKLSVPLPVAIKVGKSWGKMKRLSL